MPCQNIKEREEPLVPRPLYSQERKMAESEIDTTLTPTDQSTTFSTTLDSSSSTKHNLTGEELERRQLLHKVQLLKLEVSQKNLVIDALKNEQTSQVEELQEKLSDALHEKKLLQMRLRSMTQAYEQEFKQLQRKMQEEVAAVQERQRRLEDAPPLSESSSSNDDVKQTLHSPQISESEYLQLRTQDPSTLPLRDYVRLRYHELTQPLQRERGELERSVVGLSEQLATREKELRSCQNDLAARCEQARQLEGQCSQATRELAQVRTRVQEGNYRIENFDTVRRERDSLQSELDTLRQAMVELEAGSRASREERELARKELSTVQQSLALLRQDKEYLGRQVSELGRRASLAEERGDALVQQLGETKQAKEKLYEHFLKTREDQKLDYERQLQQEVEALRARNALEIDQLKTQTRDMFERENRSLCEARDSAFAERDRAITAEKGLGSKYEQLVKEFHQLQLSSDGRISELHGELKMKQLDCERTHVLQEETLRDLRQCELEREKLKKKVEVLTQELWQVQQEGGMRVRELEGRLSEQSQRLQVYEKLEKELDAVVMQAAEMENESDAERVLFSYGFGTSVPSTSRRRMQQSVQLARRVLQLERLNSSLRKTVEAESSRGSQLQEELSSARELLGKSQQPYGYLIEGMRVRDEQIKTGRETTAALEGEVKQLRVEKARVVETKDRMAADLERLLNHREELNLMKQVVLGIQNGQRVEFRQQPADLPAAMCHHGPGSQPQSQEHNTHSPPPTLFTKQEPPSWYRKLKQHSRTLPAQTEVPPR